MKPISPNKRVVDLNKVVWACHFYRTLDGVYRRQDRPTRPTVNGEEFQPNAWAGLHSAYPSETMLERAKRLDLIDVWIPVTRFRLNYRELLEYVGPKAQTMWAAYLAHLKSKNK